VIKQRVKLAYEKLRRRTQGDSLKMLLLQGKQMSWQVAGIPPNTDFRRVGFKVFSQWDEDGIIQYIVSNIPIKNRTFIEFGVENYEESNTRFLLLNDHWQGMVLDARAADIRYIQTDRIYWQYDLQAKCTWITRENINKLLSEAGFGEDVGLLSIDIDGNDYWIWEAIQTVRPRILIIEYNSLFGLEPIAVPYKEDLQRTKAHYSNLYYGASFGALHHLAEKKGYLLVGSNVWGHNAFFIRADIAGEFRPLDLREAYVASMFRESRDTAGKLTYVRGNDRVKLIEDMPVVQVVTGETGKLKELWKAP
jgi:hypothetical protein